MQQIHVIVTGRVQGVAYRAWTQAEAEALGVRGWVRNRRDGSVEAVLAGSKAQIETLLARMREGPPVARVDGQRVDEAHGDLPEGFEIRR